MHSSHDQARSLVGSWANKRRQITPWAYPHLRSLAITRFACGAFLAVLSGLLLARSEGGWAVLTLAGATIHFSIASLDAAAARVAHARTA